MSERATQLLLIQRFYPTINNESILEFHIPPNNRGNLQIQDAMLHFTTQVPTIAEVDVDLIPENLFGPKQFSSLEVRINNLAVTRRSCANEYYLGAYFQYLTNFATDYTSTACNLVGMFDNDNFSTAYLEAAQSADSRLFEKIIDRRQSVNENYKFEIIMPIDCSIFYTGSPLPTNTPLDLSFERAMTKTSTILTKHPSTTNVDDIQKVLTLEDVYLTIPIVKDQQTLEMEKDIVSRPIKLKFDDYDINRFNVPKGKTNVRLPNIITGQFPEKIYFGFIELAGQIGNYETSSTLFRLFEQIKATVYVDGNTVTGYPVTMNEDGVSQPYMKFLENSNKYLNCYSSKLISPKEFKLFNFFHSVSLDSNSNGTITFDFDFENAVTKDLVLITCAVRQQTLAIDHYRNFEIL